MFQFKFLKMWSLNEECTQVIKNSWNIKVSGCPMDILDKKLRILKANLKVWNKTNFGNVKSKIIEAEKILEDLQTEIESTGYNDCFQAKELKAQNDLDVALNLEEVWKEKSRLNWHLSEDKNTNFFHTYANIKRKILSKKSLSMVKALEVVFISHLKLLISLTTRALVAMWP